MVLKMAEERKPVTDRATWLLDIAIGCPFAGLLSKRRRCLQLVSQLSPV
jgi:hypothetical protein